MDQKQYENYHQILDEMFNRIYQATGITQHCLVCHEDMHADSKYQILPRQDLIAQTDGVYQFDERGWPIAHLRCVETI